MAGKRNPHGQGKATSKRQTPEAGDRGELAGPRWTHLTFLEGSASRYWCRCIKNPPCAATCPWLRARPAYQCTLALAAKNVLAAGAAWKHLGPAHNLECSRTAGCRQLFLRPEKEPPEVGPDQLPPLIGSTFPLSAGAPGKGGLPYQGLGVFSPTPHFASGQSSLAEK